MVVGLSAFPSSIIAGLLWNGVNMHASFYFSIALPAMAVMMLFFVKKKPT